MDGEKLEQVGDLVSEYHRLNGIREQAQFQIDEVKDKVARVFREAGEHNPVDIAGSRVEMAARTFESIPVQLARQGLDEGTLKKLLQQKTSIFPSIRRLKEKPEGRV